MVVEIRVSADFGKVRTLAKRMGRLPVQVGNELFRHAVDTRDALKRQFISQTKKADRTRMADRFKAKRESSSRSIVTIPRQADWLDSMKSHWVPLLRGRSITKWARENYGPSFIKRGKSRVFKGPRGGIIFNKKSKSFLFVSKDPFIQKALGNVKSRLSPRLSRIVRTTIRGGTA